MIRLSRNNLAFFFLLLASTLCHSDVLAANLDVNWGASSGTVNGYYLARFNGTDFVQIAQTAANVLSYTDSGLLDGATYCYVVRAFNSGGVSDPSNAACATTSSTSTTPPPPSSSPPPPSPSSAPPPPPTPSVTRIGSKWTDYRFSVKIRSTDIDTIGVMFRYQDDDHYYRFAWSKRDRSRRLEKFENGTVTVLAKDSAQYVTGKTYQLQINARGASLKISINGNVTFSVNDSSFPAGTVALYSYLNSGSIFDDVSVQDLSTGAVLLSDNFNDDDFNGWTIIDETSTGGPSVWSAQSGTLIQSSAIGSDAASKSGTFALYTKGTWTDYLITFNMRSTDSGCLGAMFRYQDSNNYYRLSWCDSGSFRRRLEKIANGTLTVLAEDGVSYVSGQSYQVEILAQGTTLNVWVDGGLIFSVAESSFNGGSLALYSASNAGSWFDNVLVEDLASGAVSLWDDFDDGHLVGWTIIDDKGTSAGPSNWSISSGTLVQSSNIGSATGNSLGTFALY